MSNASQTLWTLLLTLALSQPLQAASQTDLQTDLQINPQANPQASLPIHPQAEPSPSSPASQPPTLKSPESPPLLLILPPEMEAASQPRPSFDPESLFTDLNPYLLQKARELGALSIDSSSCGVDSDARISTAISRYMASYMQHAPSPDSIFKMMRAYAHGEAEALQAGSIYNKNPGTVVSAHKELDPGRCLLTQIQWKAMKVSDPKPLNDFMTMASLVSSSGTLGAAAQICDAQNRLPKGHLQWAARSVALSLALASDSLENPARLGLLYISWQSAYRPIVELNPEEVTQDHCTQLDQSLLHVEEKLKQHPALFERLEKDRMDRDDSLGYSL